MGQRAGLVEDDGVDLGQFLHVRAALDDDAGARRMGHRGQHRGWRSDADAGAVVDDHQRQEAIEICTHRCGASRKRQRRQHEAVGEFLRVILHAGIADRRRLDQLSDLACGRRRTNANGADRELAVANNGCGEHRLTLAAHHRQPFAGDGLLIDHSVAVDDLAVDRNHVTRIDDHFIADDEL